MESPQKYIFQIERNSCQHKIRIIEKRGNFKKIQAQKKVCEKKLLQFYMFNNEITDKGKLSNS